MCCMLRWIPRLLIGIAVVHVAVGLLLPNTWDEIAREGFVNTVQFGDHQRGLNLWFMITGLSWLGWGLLAAWVVRETGRLPASLGWSLIGISVPMCLIEPITGGWLVLALGAVALRASRQVTCGA
ncbi:hypothetical protein N599_10655 [Saccharopolyspora erythraea D]|nr:hypothetical protein N599_10655 [Saccharopolyspora erythraea D]